MQMDLSEILFEEVNRLGIKPNGRFCDDCDEH
jgi:hypothetical protein